MSNSNIKKRLHNLEQKLGPTDDGMIRLEELCRFMWRHDKNGFSELAKTRGKSFLIDRFNQEDVARRPPAHQRP